MAAISLSPTPVPLSNMSGRRIPLSSNQNVANSPMRSSALAKHKRPSAQVQREEQYGQPPPAKRQVIESGSQRLLKSPSHQQRSSRSQIPIQTRRNANSYENKLARERSGQHHHHQQPVSATPEYTEKDMQEILNWQKHHRNRFPKLLFYFDKVPNDAHKKLTKQIAALGGHEAAFFSIDITHIITTRPIPLPLDHRDEESNAAEKHAEAMHEEERGHDHEEVKTINPSLLTRLSEASTKRRVLDGDIRSRKTSYTQVESLNQPKRNTDVLNRAREMGKKIWSLDKLQRMVTLLLETDPYVSAEMARGAWKSREVEPRTTEDRNLLHLLHNERVNGPSDRDPTVNEKELHYFKGPYIYVYDMEEKQKPIMVREYKKVAEKGKGDWPQFRTAALGRCPFVEEYDLRESRPPPRPRTQTRAAGEAKPILQPPKMEPPRPVTGKRSLGEMERGHSRGSSVASIELSNPPKLPLGQITEGRVNAFTGRPAGRLFGGEPVASGVQPSNVTSAIRSQMVSSTATTPGLITGLSKEVHGLQRQVLKRNSTATSQDMSSRRNAEIGARDEMPAKSSFAMLRTSSRKLNFGDESTAEKAKLAPRAEKREAAPPKKTELKPGYCENCAEKYADFDEHIVSKKHRKFADDDENWVDLDDLLSQLERKVKHKYAAWPSSPSEWLPPSEEQEKIF
ncbi:Dfp1/Him1, central region-domain-containing protein [Hypoxylon trugodes]|uniref:Dfp1/Him1, central region-domain-containing protein n=1 Tax=Hypoxylon trugodes TaxID=326681 RepID=UPI00219735B6|nr:Dfp1/Him1, central region-domain-containing protein [Hypoxylon trugodes]KAI1387645.1 Dfp1/Him1, central region-domain-containing protein [Hypoxylon trugodes]